MFISKQQVNLVCLIENKYLGIDFACKTFNINDSAIDIQI